MHPTLHFRPSLVSLVAVLLSCLVATGAIAASKDSERKDVERMVTSTLKRLYKVQPSAESAVEGAAGYAVFRATGAKILLAGGGLGSGLAVDNGSEQKVSMNMADIEGGLGVGV